MKSKYKKENYISQNKGGYLNRIAFFHDVIADYIIGDDSARFTDTFVNNLDLTESGFNCTGAGFIGLSPYNLGSLIKPDMRRSNICLDCFSTFTRDIVIQYFI